MDPKSTNVLLNLTAFPGVQTNAPRGTVPAPELLLNVHLDRTGGYTPMLARSRRLENVTRALSAWRADNLFVETGGAVRYWDAQSGALTPITNAPASLAGAVTAMPDLLLTPGGWVFRTQGIAPAPQLDPAQIEGTRVTPDTGTNPAVIQPGTVYDVLVQAIATPETPVRGVKVFSDVGAGATEPYRYTVRWAGPGKPPVLRVFVREPGSPVGMKYRLVGSNVADDGRLTQAVIVRSPDQGAAFLATYNVTPTPSDDITFAVDGNTPTAYHQGRVYVAPTSATYQVIDGEEAPVSRTDTEPGRVYFSAVIAAAKADVTPAFVLTGYVDVPFRVSRRVVAIESAGPYLYIFGDRELLVLTGDPERDARIESIGDSIGAISPASVQQLGGTVYWQSDSGVLSVQGGQVREVGEAVRDQLLTLGLNVTATVDFVRETYLLTDGVTLLCYHAREQGWTTRQREGNVNPALLYGGGTPYSLQGNTLYSLGGEAGMDGTPGRLPMTLRWPYYELGDWRTRKTFNGVALGLDLATQYATVTHRSTVDGRTDQTADTVQNVTAGKSGAVRLHTARDGMNFSGCAISLEFVVDSQDSRAILRPPLTVYGTQTGEELWTDDAQ